MRAHPIARVLAVLAAATLLVGPAGAQDPEIELFLLASPGAEPLAVQEASSIQFVRLPIGFTLRDEEDVSDKGRRRWGLRLTLPLSIGLYEIDAGRDVLDAGSDAPPSGGTKRVEALTITPGVELRLPVGEHWMLKPFGEVGVARSPRTDNTEVLFSLGLKVRWDRDLPWGHLTVGGAGKFASNRSRRSFLADYTTLEVGLDVQFPLRGRGRRKRTGIYGIARYFPELEFQALPLGVVRTWEAGLSFTTEPVLRLWRIEMPWIAIGYRWGDLFDGVRVSLQFPF